MPDPPECDRFAAMQVRAARVVWVLAACFAACATEVKPTAMREPTAAVEQALAGSPAERWAKEAEQLLALADRPHDAKTRARAIGAMGAFADRAPPTGTNAQTAAELRQRLYARAAELAFDADIPRRALRLANRGLRAPGSRESRFQLLTLVARAKRALGDEPGAAAAELEAQASSAVTADP